VYKIGDKGKDTYLYNCTATEFATDGLSEIQESYGAGDYRIRVYLNGRILSHRRISVGPSRKALRTPQNPPMDIGAMMAQNNTLMMQGFREIVQSMQQNQPRQEALGVKEVITLMSSLQGFAAPPAREHDPLDMLVKMLEIQKTIAPPLNVNGEVDGGAIMLEAVKSFGGIFGEVLKQKAATAPAPIYAEPQLPAPTYSAELTPAPQMAQNPIQNHEMPNPAEDTEMTLKLRIMAGPVLMAAQSDSDPYSYACMLLDFADEEMIRTYIDDPNWFAHLTKVIPDVARFPDWFNRLRQEVLTLLNTPDDGDSMPQSQTPQQ